ncbi:hypothetical protein [Larkinella soli]|uniref:hypothetical protein n=1 Tax=Larkinella soli TaxID=1770527 RepID=UPI000FFB813A|nr:hypothetical protein [Larkinella soli]
MSSRFYKTTEGIPGRAGRRRACLLMVLFLLAFSVPAQTPKGVFISDTVEIGKPFQYSLSLLHRPAADVLFPDTARFFAPFLVRDISIFSTRTNAKGSLDSAVYTLVSFETSPMQTLRVPVILIRNGTDSVSVFSNTDTVRLRERIQSRRLDTLRLSTYTDVVTLRQQMNYPLLFVILLGTLGGVGIVFLFFGRDIRTRILRYRLHRQHLDFHRSFNRMARSIGPETAHEEAGRAVVLWKEYMEWLEGKPYTSLTTREIVESVRDNRLADALKEIDGVVYGGVYSDQTQQSLRVLSELADIAYYRRSVQLLNNPMP